jgi:hypothetical protein
MPTYGYELTRELRWQPGATSLGSPIAGCVPTPRMLVALGVDERLVNTASRVPSRSPHKAPRLLLGPAFSTGLQQGGCPHDRRGVIHGVGLEGSARCAPGGSSMASRRGSPPHQGNRPANSSAAPIVALLPSCPGLMSRPSFGKAQSTWGFPLCTGTWDIGRSMSRAEAPCSVTHP